jgi:hypothetical protein
MDFVKRVTRLIALGALISVSSAVSAQITFACQHINANGFTHRDNKWNRSGFSVGKPFFIKLNQDGFPDQNSLKAIGLMDTPGFNACRKGVSRSELIHCSDALGAGLSFNSRTGEGAWTYTFGAVTRDERTGDRDDVGVGIFVCQKM